MFIKNSELVSPDVVYHRATVTRERREIMNGHRSAIFWFTGLSGSGKSTLSHVIEEYLHRIGCRTFVLDGDNVRHSLCGDLSFSVKDRKENIRRIGEVCKLFMEAGVIVLAAFISPFREDRNRVRSMVESGEFFEIYCKCPVEVCEQRDVKGLYKKAKNGEIEQFTGISSPYEAPELPELILNTSDVDLNDCVDKIISTFLKNIRY